MSRSLLIVLVGLASYAALNAIVSLVVMLAWRVRHKSFVGHPLFVGHPFRGAAIAPAARARRIVWLRALPFLVATAITLVVVVPAFAIFEPIKTAESAGPVMWLLAGAAGAQFAASAWLAAATALRTRAVASAWLRSSRPLDVNPPAGVPAFAVDSRAPIVALVGVFSPKLIAARSVLDSCSAQELTSIVAHERGHVQARDNLKRWLMACVPDALRWTPLHDAITDAWHDAAEDAADDVATGGDAGARLDLAALLVKIARLTPEPSWPAATVSPFVERDGLDRRVRRLLAAVEVPPSRTGALVPLGLGLAAALALAAAVSPAVLKDIYDIVEAVIAFGR